MVTIIFICPMKLCRCKSNRYITQLPPLVQIPQILHWFGFYSWFKKKSKQQLMFIDKRFGTNKLYVLHNRNYQGKMSIHVRSVWNLVSETLHFLIMSKFITACTSTQYVFSIFTLCDCVHLLETTFIVSVVYTSPLKNERSTNLADSIWLAISLSHLHSTNRSLHM